MIVLLVLLIIVFASISYLFFAPFYLEINTSNNLYRLRFHRLASFSLTYDRDTIMAEVKIAWWKKEFDVLASKPEVKTSRVEKKVQKSSKEKMKLSWQKIKALMGSFKVNRCVISIDSGDVQLNGILYPVFFGLSVYTKQDIRINFVDEVKVILEIKNSLARMSWAYLNS